jgi:hypothetical protein
VERLFHLPTGLGYKMLYKILHSRPFLGQFKALSREGGWQPDYFNAYVEGQAPVTQICPFVWLSASLGALVVVKHLSGKMEATTLPNYWKLTASGINLETITV